MKKLKQEIILVTKTKSSQRRIEIEVKNILKAILKQAHTISL